ncbi:MAG: hypothetical protein VYC76_00705 [Pseudomonadota bacterium]|nr:hypothetical protein [Pseudomonadota bacterium]
MSKRGDTTARDNFRNIRVVQIEEMLAKPGFTKQERKMLKDKIKLIKRGDFDRTYKAGGYKGNAVMKARGGTFKGTF